jgi:hypothetical protein
MEVISNRTGRADRQDPRGQRPVRQPSGSRWALPDVSVSGCPGQVVMRSGDLVRRVNERFADDYMLLELP